MYIIYCNGENVIYLLCITHGFTSITTQSDNIVFINNIYKMTTTSISNESERSNK
jgi:ABC-type polysaccharide/polyol phosphate transport system ATPase subunit